jgi:hypothetical protein
MPSLIHASLKLISRPSRLPDSRLLGEKLLFVHRPEIRDGFDLHDDFVRHYQIGVERHLKAGSAS